MIKNTTRKYMFASGSGESRSRELIFVRCSWFTFAPVILAYFLAGDNIPLLWPWVGPHTTAASVFIVPMLRGCVSAFPTGAAERSPIL